MEHQDDTLAFVINIHQRLSRDFPLTPYNMWCQKVHALPLSPTEKWERLLSWDMNPREYTDQRLFRYDWQLLKLLSKCCPDGVPSEQDKAVAYAKFLSAEERCDLVNQYYSSSNVAKGSSSLLLGVSKIVNSVLGPVEDFFNWVELQSQSSSTFVPDLFTKTFGKQGQEKWDSLCAAYGPGISVGRDSDKLVSLSEKLLLGSVTADCRYLASWLRSVFEGLPSTAFEHVVRGSCLTFVVKRVGEARTICFEPSMNMLIQKLIGLYIKFMLKTKLGIDLLNQERNRSLAKLGSLCDSYATEDLSSASDLNAAIPVLHVCSPGWFRLLDDCRSKEYFDPMKKEWCVFHKFSTMGNGFTFELETLVFAAIAKYAIDSVRKDAIAWREIAVYGDDLLFPKEYAAVVEQALLMFGHIPNYQKSFHMGPFRESCGGDYFYGVNVTPFKIKEVSCNDPTSIVNIYNGLFISARENPDCHSICNRFSRALRFVERWLRSRYPRIGDGEIESRYSNTLVEYTFEPSNRWLFCHSPIVNVAYSKYEQRLVPRWLLLNQEKPRSKYGRVLDYDITTEYLRYVTANGGQHVSIWEQNFRFRRNIALYRPKRLKVRDHGTASSTCEGDGLSVNAVPTKPRKRSKAVPMAHFHRVLCGKLFIICDMGTQNLVSRPNPYTLKYLR